jgi:hypothetical protein
MSELNDYIKNVVEPDEKANREIRKIYLETIKSVKLKNDSLEQSITEKDKLIEDLAFSLQEYKDELCNLEMHKKSCQYTYYEKGCTCYIDEEIKKLKDVLDRAEKNKEREG